MKKTFLRKLINFISIVAILSQSLTPYAVLLPQPSYAQTVDQTTQAPTPTPDQTTVTPTPTTAPTSTSITPTPTDTVTVTPTPTPDQSTLTPTPTVDPSTLTATPTPVDNNSPPATNDATNTNNQNLLNNQTPTPTPTNNSNQSSLGNEHVNMTILKNVSAPQIDLGQTASQQSAVLTTDKPDYAPTDTALITGTGFTQGATYTLLITSVNNYSFQTNVTADNKGNIAYAYQLDGTYRPLYTVQVKDGSGTVIATTTFTDSISTCVNDAQGANDEPGQKDLTKMCADYTGLPTSEMVSWDWDDGSWPGGNTGDACALFDTNGDGLVNYALCVTVSGNPATLSSKTLYSCGNDKPDRCDNPVNISTITSACSASVQATDPFPAGSDYPNDTVGSCTVNMSDVGGSTANLLDVCSYPSSQPNSDPSDCIVASTANQTGTVELKKVWSGTPGQTTLNIGTSVNGTEIANVQTGVDGGTPLTTGTKIVSTGTYFVSETGGLTNYNASLSCTKNGQAYSPGTNNSLTVGNNDVFVCTFTNTLNTGTITVHKDVQGLNGEAVTDTSHQFTVRLDGANPQLLTDGGSYVYTATSGAHTITEDTPPTGYSLYSMTPSNPTVVAGQNTDVYVVNRQQPATIIVSKVMKDPDGNPITTDTHSFTANVGTQSASFAYGTNAQFTVNPGSYTVTESPDTNYSELGCKLVSGADAGVSFTVNPGDSISVTCTNQQKKAHINVTKNVLNPDGADASDNHAFTAQLNGGNDQSFSEATSAAYLNLNPGNYSITELTDSNYEYVSCTPDSNQNPADGAQVTVGSNGSVLVTCTNKQKVATITVLKVVEDANGNPTNDSTHFTAQLNGGNDLTIWQGQDPQAAYTVNPGGPFAVTETGVDTSKYTSLDCKLPTGADASGINLGSNGSVTVTCTNKQVGGTISGTKYDSLGNKLAGWTMQLVSCLTGFTGCSDVLGASTVTDGNGFYIFDNLITGFYQVREILKAGWTQITHPGNITINPGTQSTGNDFVNFKNVSVTACKKVDADGDIATTDDQSNKLGWTVNLLDGNGGVLDTQTTGDNGCHTWTDLGPGSYGVSEATSSTWTALTPTSYNFGAVTGGSDYVYTFVNFQNISISGHKFNDLNGNGVWDKPAEAGLSGWTINLSGAKTDSTTTDVNGAYTFSNLGPGTYTLSEKGQTGWHQTAPGRGTFTVNAQSGTDVTDEDFGNQGQGSITVHKMVDRNGNETYVSGDDSEFTWTLDGVGSKVMGSTDPTVPAGDHTVGENDVTNYHFVGWYPTGALDGKENPYSCTNLPEVHDLPITVNVGPDGTSNFTLCNQRDTGTIQIAKVVDPHDNGASTWDFSIKGPTNNTADGVTELQASSVFTSGTGDYTVTEAGGSENLSNYDTSYSCVDQSENELTSGSGTEATFTLSTGINALCTFTNTVKRGSITFEKTTDPRESEQSFGFVLGGKATGSATLYDGGSQTFDDLLPGDYTLGENATTGWDLTNAYCTSNQNRSVSYNGTDDTAIILHPGENITCSFTNTQRGSISGYKWNDLNGNHIRDCLFNPEFNLIANFGCEVYSEETLSGWGINLYQNVDDEPSGNPITTTTDNDGNYSFTNVIPGDYYVCEEQKTGWEQTYPYPYSEYGEYLGKQYGYCYPISLNAGQNLSNEDFGNHNLAPIFSIEKTNDTLNNNKAPGDTVVYTLTLTISNDGGPATNIKVTDLLPSGFHYNSGSWKVVLNDITTLNVPEPTYASPGTWNLVDTTNSNTPYVFQPDDVITLKYSATIDGSQATGKYPDNAWAQGTGVGTSDVILATAGTNGNIEDPNFVGTQVTVVSPNDQSTGFKSTTTKDVLGASTYLPATGENTLWVIIATLLGLSGLVTLAVGLKFKRNE